MTAVLTGPILTVPGTKICFQNSEKDGWLSSWDGGETWHFQMRSLNEILEMFPSIERPVEPTTDEEKEREIFGETLDEPIPDDLWDMIKTPT